MTTFANLNIDNWCGEFRTRIRTCELKPTSSRSPLNLLAEVACAAR